MLPGECDNGSPVAPGAPLGCPTNVDGLAYDAGDDSIWFSPDASQRIYHFTTDGMLLGFYDVNEPGSQMEPDCANFSSGIAVADHSPTPIMFDMAGSCSNWFQYGSSDVNQPTKQQVYRTYDGTRAEDDECGYAQLPNGQLVSAVWVRDEQDGILRAFQVPSCIVGGGVAIAPDKSRMTGGGGLPTVDPLTGLPNGGTAHHGFMLHCSAQVNPSRLQVSWGNGNHFHMTTIDTSSCTNTAHPTAPSTFDTITGSGHGRYNGHPGATVQWTFKDNGEPGSTDYGDVTVRDQNGVVVMHAQGVLATGSLPGEGNYQSHQAS
jgi:hypothetical protein